MEMSLSLSADQRSEIEQGRLLTAVVGSSLLKCVVVRADLIEQYGYLSDASPDSAVQEVSEAIAATDSDDWKSPKQWRGWAGKLIPRLLFAFLAVWAVAASCLATGFSSSLRQSQFNHDEQLKRTLIPSVQSFQKWKTDGARLTVDAFKPWLHLAKKTPLPNGMTQFDWAIGGREDGHTLVCVKVESSQCVMAIDVYRPEF